MRNIRSPDTDTVKLSFLNQSELNLMIIKLKHVIQKLIPETLPIDSDWKSYKIKIKHIMSSRII